MRKEYEIRVRRNTWDRAGGWNWRVYELLGWGAPPSIVDWGWSEDANMAWNDANYAFEILEENAS